MRRRRQGHDRWAGREPVFPLVVRVLAALLWPYISVEVKGRERLPRSGPVLLCANHPSKLDPVVLGVQLFLAGRKVRFLAVSGLWRVPIVGWALRTGRMVPVYRSKGAERMVRDACEALEAGEAVLVYPEGRVARPDEQAPGKPGAGLLAIRTKAPVLPVASWGLAPSQRLRRGIRRRAGIVIGEQIDVDAWRQRSDRQAQLEVSAAMLHAVRSLIPQAQRLAGGHSRSLTRG